jgi:hypothetical protein
MSMSGFKRAQSSLSEFGFKVSNNAAKRRDLNLRLLIILTVAMARVYRYIPHVNCFFFNESDALWHA